MKHWILTVFGVRYWVALAIVILAVLLGIWIAYTWPAMTRADWEWSL